MTIDHIQLAIPPGNEATARAFYVGVLGFEEVPKPAHLLQRGGAWFRCGDAALHVGVDEAFVPAKKAHPALRVHAYDEVVESCRAHGVDVLIDEHLFEGARHCYVSDPFGNRIELIAQDPTVVNHQREAHEDDVK